MDRLHTQHVEEELQMDIQVLNICLCSYFEGVVLILCYSKLVHFPSNLLIHFIGARFDRTMNKLGFATHMIYGGIKIDGPYQLIGVVDLS